MRIRIIVFVALLSVALPMSGAAGEEGYSKRCSAEADVCVRQMMAKLENRGWIGIEMDGGNDRKIVTRVVPGSPAERSGLNPGDAILAFNGISLSEGDEAVWAEVKKSMTPGREVTVTIERSGKSSDVVVTLAKLPKELLAQWIGQHMLDGHAEVAEKPEAPEAVKPSAAGN